MVTQYGIHQRNVAKLHEALVNELSSIVDTWWTDEQAAFPRRMPLEPHEEDLLRGLHEQCEANNLRPFRECQVHWRSDLVLPSDHPGTAKICEINTRYSINAQLLAAYGYRIYETAAERGCVFARADARKFIKSQLDLFEPKYPIHIVRDQYRSPYSEMFVSFAEKSGRVSATMVKPVDLRMVRSNNSKTGYDLYCLSDRDCPDIVSTDGERLDRVYQTGLDLFQHELRLIPTDILRHLALHSVNDLRSILLIHDKRILGVLLQELDSLLSKQVLTAEQAAIIRHGVVPIINPGSPELSELINQQSRSLIHKDNYTIKPVRSGRGDGILLGKELSVSNGKVSCSIFANPSLNQITLWSCHLANGSFTGLGFWRAGGTKICNLNSEGLWMLGVVARPN
ncbi:hypothetical protein BO82DRAFT_396923 [Aspergillus uvarum CBS 121591]|uniref:Uncharacterized protein n=1 Tax=Aspergillus uvarum CBS 121591 TaxID=1448315 RepID=A0A319CRY0_9EURO|nr:hypothetical protein BO82DRAFT_396923 [Aspergillus uvarum CBS 121591]PYH86981.1 hypothetical protein BO82DRAFT_396923 [Aspergillus uvarum CBS 121591]